jgi:hypothetical protein
MWTAHDEIDTRQKLEIIEHPGQSKGNDFIDERKFREIADWEKNQIEDGTKKDGGKAD